MMFIRAGKRILNLCFVIDSAEKEGATTIDDIPDGGIELHMLPGRRLVLGPDEANDYRRAMERVIPPRGDGEDRTSAGSTGETAPCDGIIPDSATPPG